MKYFKSVSVSVSIFAAVFLAGCEVPVMIAANNAGGEMTSAFKVSLPAVVLVKLDTGEEDFLTGNLIGHISGRSEVALTGAKTGMCKGKTNTKGEGILQCSNGLDLSISADTSGGPKMSGVESQIGQIDARGLKNFGFTKKPEDPSRVRYVSAFGWGKMANDAAVRAVVAPLAAKEFGVQ